MVNRFIWEIECGKKDRKLFHKAIKSLDKMARQTHDLRIFTDGERRYGNLLFEICYELVHNGKPGQPKKTFKRGVHFRIKNKGTQAHKKGRKRPKYQSPWREHPETARTITETDIHANHAEAFFSALRRKCATFRRKTNMYKPQHALLIDGLTVVVIRTSSIPSMHHARAVHFSRTFPKA